MPQPSMLDLAPSLQEPGKRLVDAGELSELFGSLMNVQLNVTASGTDATDSAMVTEGFTWVTATSNNGGLLMGPGALGQQQRIYSDVATGSVTLFASPGGGLIDVGQNSTSAASELSVAGGEVATMVCIGPGMWVRAS